MITINIAIPTSLSLDFKTLEVAIIAVTPQIDVPIASNFDSSFWSGHNFERTKYVKNINKNTIAIKATTNEKSGLIGKGDFIACWSNISLKDC